MTRALGVAVAAAALLSVSAGAAEEQRLHALWHDGEGTSRFTGLLSLENFNDTAHELIADGFRLIDVETARLNGSQAFAGLFVEATGSNFLEAGHDLATMRERMRARRAEGLRLSDFEIYRQGGQRRFVGVFRPGSGQQRLVPPLHIARFLERKELMRTLGFRLIDVEAIVVGGQYRFAGLYRTDAPRSVFTGFRPRPNFVQLRDRMASDGWELFDVERAVNAGGDDVYFGLWRRGDGPSILSRFRTPAEQLLLAASQEEQGRVGVDVELKLLADEDTGSPPRPPPPTPPELPGNPDNVAFTDDRRMRIEFSIDGGLPQRITIPRAWLPAWLPQHEDGEYVLPDTFCALNIRHADRVFWQVPGDPAVGSAPFQSLGTVPSEWQLEGISFAGPMGACADEQTPWQFPVPLTTDDVPFVPLPDMSLVIEGVDGELQFQSSAAPHAEPFDALELFSADFEDELLSVLDLYQEVAEREGNVDRYCAAVGAYWTFICSLTEGSDCPLPQPDLPVCN